MKSIRIAALLVLVAVMASSPIARSQAPAPDRELEYLDLQARSFLNRISVEVSEAYAELLKGGPLARSEGLSALEQKTRTIPERFGEFRAVEQISARRIGKDVVTLKYLYHCDTYRVVWHITYYRSYKRNEAPPRRELARGLVPVRHERGKPGAVRTHPICCNLPLPTSCLAGVEAAAV